MTRRLIRASRTRCLGERVADYVSGTLTPDERRACDRHLVACEVCRQRVEQERRITDTLRRADPGVPGDLRTLLLSVATQPPRTGSVGRQGDGPAPPRGGLTSRVETLIVPRHRAEGPLPVLSPQAPAFHRSALRSALLATAAAGLSAAAAWSLGVGVSAGAALPDDLGDSVSGTAPVVERTAPPTDPGLDGGDLVGTLMIWTGGVTATDDASPTTGSPTEDVRVTAERSALAGAAAVRRTTPTRRVSPQFAAQSIP